jgi:hypothetical protein
MIAAMKVFCSHSSSSSTSGLELVNLLREKCHIDITSPCNISKPTTNATTESQLPSVPSLKKKSSFAIALNCVSYLRQCNPVGAIRPFSLINETIAEMSVTNRLIMAALMHHLLPELRLCRLILSNLSANKDEEADLVRIDRVRVRVRVRINHHHLITLILF